MIGLRVRKASKLTEQPDATWRMCPHENNIWT